MNDESETTYKVKILKFRKQMRNWIPRRSVRLLRVSEWPIVSRVINDVIKDFIGLFKRSDICLSQRAP